jgi:hypothetical protein
MPNLTKMSAPIASLGIVARAQEKADAFLSGGFRSHHRILHMGRYAVMVSAHVCARNEHSLIGCLHYLNWGITLSVRSLMVVITTSRGTDDVQLTSNMISSVLKSSRSI